MTGTERFQALMQGRLPDRVPVVCNLLDQGAAEVGLAPAEYYSRAEHVARGRVRLREKYGYDTVVGTFYLALEAEVLGSRHVVFAQDGAPNLNPDRLVIHGERDIERLEVPADLADHPRFREQAACVRLVKQGVKGEAPVVAIVTGSFSLPAILMGIGPWLELLMCGRPAAAQLLLEKCSLFCRRHVAALREAGADLIVYANSVATADVITLRQFRELALPALQRDLDGLGTADLVYFNGGGRINPHLGHLLAETPLRAFYISPLDDVAEAKRALTGRGLLIASINDIALIGWSAAEIDAEVGRIMKAGKDGGGFAFATLAMPLAIPERNIRAMLESAARHGAYGA